jgi:hypothetical protein
MSAICWLKMYKKLYSDADCQCLQMRFNPNKAGAFGVKCFLLELAYIMQFILCFISSLLSPGKAGSALAELAFLRLQSFKYTA